MIKNSCDCLTVRPSDLITTLTDVPMDNYCPCFFYISQKKLRNSMFQRLQDLAKFFLAQSFMNLF